VKLNVDIGLLLDLATWRTGEMTRDHRDSSLQSCGIHFVSNASTAEAHALRDALLSYESQCSNTCFSFLK
jgi:hypothetical protein